MQKRGIIIGLLITAIGLTAFGFVNKEKTDSTSHKEEVVEKKNVIFNNFRFELNNFPVGEEIFYFVSPGYRLSTTAEKLENAKLISDLIEDYPSNWIKDYVSVEIESTCNGKELKAIGANDVLSLEQINLLNTVDLSAVVLITVKYQTTNPITSVKEDREMKISLTVVPEVEAAFIGGYDEMIAYLKENSYDKISAKNLQPFPRSVLKFTVNETGKTENIELTQSSGDTEIDNVLIEVVKGMPEWKPAVNAKGVPVKQGFEFSVGPPDC